MSSERTYQLIMDWVRRIMQASLLATIILYAYVLYGLFAGDVTTWSTITDAAAKTRILDNVTTFVSYLNIALVVLLFSSTVLFYEDERYGYLLLLGAAAFYFGIPLALSVAMPDAVAAWGKSGNLAASTIYDEFKKTAILMAIPSALVVLRGLILRITGSAAKMRDARAAMQYGGNAKTETPPSGSIIGVMSKCWQLPYCRDAVRKHCPIYLRRAKCWKHRVGCMCEELVIRGAMDDIINRETIVREKPKAEDGGLVLDGASASAPNTEAAAQKTEELPVPSKNVAIPYNKALPMYAKRERCRNCVIYNEHQRLKYQLFAPAVVIAIPAVAYYYLAPIRTVLQAVLGGVDQVMAKLSLTATAANTGVQQTVNSTGVFAEYMVIGCLVIIATSIGLRFLEHLVFKLKI